jgi:nucleoside-diphosphate-sugar epimerase
MSHAPSFEKILVTGGSGFIGQHLLRALNASDYRPAALARNAEKVERLPADVREQTRWIELDLSNHVATRDVIQAEQPTVLFHLAGARGRGNDESARRVCTEMNVRATVNLLEAAQGAGVERVVMLGSADEYGKQAGPLSESLSVQPLSAYGISKTEATRQAQAMHATSGCPVVVLRPFTVYGTHQPHWMFVADAIECAVNRLPFRMSEGTQKRDLVNVSDVVRAILAAANSPHVEGKVINVGSGKPESLRDVAQLIWHISESDAPLLLGARPASADELHDTWADISLARELLDWEPRVSLADGLREMIERAREDGSLHERTTAAL